MQYQENHIGMKQAFILHPKGKWSIIKPHSFTMGVYEIAFIDNDGDMIEIDGDTIKRFDTEEEALTFIDSFEVP